MLPAMAVSVLQALPREITVLITSIKLSPAMFCGMHFTGRLPQLRRELPFNFSIYLHYIKSNKVSEIATAVAASY